MIAGAARGIPLLAPPGGGTRPTSDLLKGAIFNMLAPAEPFERVADLYAGSGALGIEALSRGAAHATFVEQQARTCRVIGQNLRAARLAEAATVVCAALPGALARLAGPFDLVLLDPPYDTVDLPALLERLAALGLAAPGALAVAEHRGGRELPATIGPWQVWKQRRQGDGAVTLYRHAAQVVAVTPATGPGATEAEGAER